MRLNRWLDDRQFAANLGRRGVAHGAPMGDLGNEGACRVGVGAVAPTIAERRLHAPRFVGKVGRQAVAGSRSGPGKGRWPFERIDRAQSSTRPRRNARQAGRRGPRLGGVGRGARVGASDEGRRGGRGRQDRRRGECRQQRHDRVRIAGLSREKPQRTGDDPSFPTSARISSAAGWSTALDGAVYAEPLVVERIVHRGHRRRQRLRHRPCRRGTILWRRGCAALPVPLSSLPCGDIDPLGITGTPAYDSATGSLFVLAEVTGFHHILFALDPTTGAVRWSRTVDLAGDESADAPAASGPRGRQRLHVRRIRRAGRRLRPVRR